MVMNCHKIWSDIKLVPSCISFHTYRYFIKFHIPLSLYSFCGSKTADTNELVFTIRARRSKNYSLVNIGNMDETPVWFDMPTSKTVDSVGAKTVLLKTTGHEKTRFTVVLACLADGTKLKPMVIFKRKTMPKDNFPAGVVVHNHPKGWMDESGVKIWIKKVWQARPGGFANTQSLLVWDSFSAHLTDIVKQQLHENKTATAVIPGGLTSLVQPLDVCLNKPFKDRLWEKWMTSGEKTFTPGG